VDELDGPVDGPGHGRCEPHPVTDVGGLAADDEGRGEGATELAEAGEDGDRSHAVRVELALPEVLGADSEHRQVAR
jgi:hypothetical protein